MDPQLTEFYLMAVLTILALVVPVFYVFSGGLNRDLADAVTQATARNVDRDELRGHQDDVKRFFWATDFLLYMIAATGLATILAGLAVWHNGAWGERPVALILRSILVLWVLTVSLISVKVVTSRRQWRWFSGAFPVVVASEFALAMICAGLTFSQNLDALLLVLFGVVLLHLAGWFVCGWMFAPLSRIDAIRQMGSP